MSGGVHVKETAEEDLDAIYEKGIEDYGEVAAREYIRSIEEKFRLLATAPKRAKYLKADCYHARVGKAHYAYYDHDPDSGDIEILRVVSHRADPSDSEIRTATS